MHGHKVLAYENADKLVVVPLAWNFFDEIKSNVEEIREGKSTQYVQYFPNVMYVV